MAGNPADLTIYIDSTINNNHTYYGNGCPNPWETGSITPCATRIVKTADNEDLENGTYYNFQAISTGSGGTTLSTNNANTPDTFCPLGWQLPYSGTGGDYYNKSRSWYYLFNVYDIAFNDGDRPDAAKIKSYPFSYVYSGTIRWTLGKLFNQTNGGYYWSSTVGDSGHGYTMSTWLTAIRPNLTESKNYGEAVRCNSRISTLNPKQN